SKFSSSSILAHDLTTLGSSSTTKMRLAAIGRPSLVLDKSWGRLSSLRRQPVQAVPQFFG
ncbi:MAG: hypothetical protein KAW49_12735, partial [Anaerolineae bacterium]|nr:hypothetical protein [Anaerolineae bacterium]